MTIEELEYELVAGEDRRGDRTPPQDLDAERSVLGGMMISKDAIADVVEQLRGHDFYRPAHEVVYDAIIDLYGRGEPADAVTVADELTKRGELARVGGAPYLHTLIATVPTAANAGYYARIVRERAVLRRLVEAGTRIVQLGYGTDGGDVDDLVNTAQAEVYAVTERRASEDYLPLSQIITETVDEIEAVSGRGGGMHGVPTGFADLDHLTNGLHPGQMIVLAARPAIGKSTLGIDIARSAAIKNGQTAVVFSLEMSRSEITMRLLAAESRVHLQRLRTGQMADDDWQKVAATMGRISEAPLFIDDSPNMSLMEIRAKCRRLKQRHDLKLVVIDYLQLMTSGKRVESRQQEVSEFSRALKLLAKELEVPLIAISQLNRGPEQRTDKKPQMSDLRESGCLVADTRVLRADTGATTTLGELYALGARDVMVWALDERLGYVRRHLTHVFPTGVRPAFRLTTASGRQVTATANHPFLTVEGWCPLGELSAGSRIGVPRHVPAPGLLTHWCDRRVRLLAHLLAAGAFGLDQPVRYLTTDPDCASTLKAAAEVLDTRSVEHRSSDSRALIVRLEPRRTDEHARNQVADWLDDLGLLRTSAVERFVPEAVSSLPKAQVALFLRHLWSAAGSVTVHRHTRLRREKSALAWSSEPIEGVDERSEEYSRGGLITYRSGSRRMLEDVATLLLRFGITTRIAEPSRGVVPVATLEIVGLDDQRRFLQEIGVIGVQTRTAERLLDVVRARQAATAQARAAVTGGELWSEVGEVLDRIPQQSDRPPISGGVPRVLPAQMRRSPDLGGVDGLDRSGPDHLAPDHLETDDSGLDGLGLGASDPASLSQRTRTLLEARQDAPALDDGRGRVRSALAEIVDLLDAADLELDAVNDIAWDTVVSITPVGDRPVYDATVLGAHNFVADGIAVHNSIEQDADMVILLHREDAYERESPRAGEADLIVAKHRNGPTDTITVAFQGHYSRFVDMQA
ncbi:MAG: replicative DNA helicase [Micrococcales bacterium]|nr:replicative DNA helicase [Micrococcales bacterium]